MTLSPGVRLGPYEILDRLGAGGMGEVYRAHDTRLDRTVAIKVLAHHLTRDPDMRRRFEREARAVASLSHPHICHLNDIGQHEGTDFLVMEYLEGETLAQRLTRPGGSHAPPLPIDEVLRYAVEMAEALNEAHRHGIVHRDLKPGNVIITKSGVKLLDFGLAKLQPAGVGSAAALSTMAHRQQPLTDKGTIVGTWQYMAPEQLEGKEADARSDIFAFGAVVYEMATGRKAFEGESHASLIAAILEREPPPMLERQPVAPPALDRVVRKCLAKSPDARWQTARDLADELKWIADERTPSSQIASGAPVARPRATAWRWAGAIAVASLAGAAIVWNLPRRNDVRQPIGRFVFEPPASAALASSDFAISPDGQQLVYTARTPRGEQLYARAMDQLDVRPLPGTEDGGTPFFSPDGQWLGFVADRKLKKVQLSASAPALTLSDCVECLEHAATWLPDDSIIVAHRAIGLMRVQGQGGTPVPLTQPTAERHEIDHHSPARLPGGKALLVTVHRGAEAFEIAVYRLDTGEWRLLVQNAFDAQYIATGHLAFARGDALFAAPFDVDRLEVTGPAVAVLENLATAPGNGTAWYRIAEDGTLAYLPAISRQGRRLVWIDRLGAAEPLPTGSRAFAAPSLSPDGRRLAVQIDEATRSDIWIYDFGNDALSRVTFDGASEAPVWTPDGKRLTFSLTKEGRRQIYWQPADGGGQPELLVTDEHSVWPGSWSPDAQTLAYMRQPPTDLDDIGLLRLGESRSTALVLDGPAAELFPRISPDGRWLAYASYEAGPMQVYVIGLSGFRGKRQITTEGGGWPVWSRDGRELFYRNGSRFFVVPVGSLPDVGRPMELPARGRVAGSGTGHPGYDVSPDGKRLLMVEQAQEESAPRQIHIVLNWVEELKRRVPTR